MKKFLKRNYSKSWNFIKESRSYIYFIVIVFFLFVIIGSFITIPAIVEKIMQFIQEILEKTKDMGFWELTWFILWNNVKVSIFGVLLGIIFGVIPVAFAITNGYLLGFVASMSVRSEGLFSLWRIFPHGIFELPAVFISLALGVRLGLYLFFRTKKTSFKKNLKESLRVFVFIVIPLLIIGAFIESAFIFIFR
jgi:stage II sporulation protein M